MFNFRNLFGNFSLSKKKDITKNDDKSPNYAQRIIINDSEKKKFNLDGVVGEFYVESVYDGDTITVLVPSKTHIYNMINSNQIDEDSDTNKLNTIYFNQVRLRLLGIDTPEIKPPKDLPDRELHIEKAKSAKKFLLDLILNKIIKVEFLTNDKYGRPLAKIYFNNQCLNDLMVEKGYAKKYDGGTKDTNF
jgi:endonuclease YncB( thermonuclease family)